MAELGISIAAKLIEVENLSEFGEEFQRCASSLRSLEIRCCSNLRRLSGEGGGLELLTSLESLDLDSNNQLSFCEDGVNDNDMPWKSLHQSLRNLQFSYTDMMNLPKGIQYLTSLQSLSLGSCWNVTNLPEWISCLSSLQSLSIEKCSAIKSLPDSMRNLASLQQLVIKSCTELEERCKEPNGEDWPKIQHIPHVDIR
ncbi:hypothetical protein SOVF_098040 [Spinacia oleracea]|nr:hypothetical protein SOVF_098040 [Spinacia oleracea]